MMFPPKISPKVCVGKELPRLGVLPSAALLVWSPEQEKPWLALLRDFETEFKDHLQFVSSGITSVHWAVRDYLQLF